MIYQGFHNLPLTQKQVKYNTIQMLFVVYHTKRTQTLYHQNKQ